ncbi:MAG: AMP-polyphosphate phosphotransferase [Solirubrobacteraceae bacterium]|nr:AMP-polyphosphate phosphotransferase [Solirubrobacteraceae bacterium]
MSRLDAVDLTRSLSAEEETRRLSKLQRRLLTLRLQLGGLLGAPAVLGPAVCVLFEGWDASGKGGAIRRLVAPLDPRHISVVQFAAPGPEEHRRHFLHRFAGPLPGRGGMAVFDRTWYGRVLVERVEGLATPAEWSRAYEEIVGFERGLVLEDMVVVKFWIHVSAAEQLRRFERRAADPLKRWKLTEEDWRNRERRADYEQAVEDMLERTDRPWAPWRLIAGESKRYARVAVLRETIAAIEAAMIERGIEPVADVQ